MKFKSKICYLCEQIDVSYCIRIRIRKIFSNKSSKNIVLMDCDEGISKHHMTIGRLGFSKNHPGFGVNEQDIMLILNSIVSKE